MLDSFKKTSSLMTIFPFLRHLYYSSEVLKDSDIAGINKINESFYSINQLTFDGIESDYGDQQDILTGSSFLLKECLKSQQPRGFVGRCQIYEQIRPISGSFGSARLVGSRDADGDLVNDLNTIKYFRISPKIDSHSFTIECSKGPTDFPTNTEFDIRYYVKGVKSEPFFPKKKCGGSFGVTADVDKSDIVITLSLDNIQFDVSEYYDIKLNFKN